MQIVFRLVKQARDNMHNAAVYPGPMDTPGKRLTHARIAAGFGTARDAAERLGTPYPTYVSHENGTRSMPPARAERYARAFGVRPDWLLFGADGNRPNPVDKGVAGSTRLPVTMLPVRHVVQAGWWREVDDVQDWPDPPIPMLAIPGFPADAQWAERVQGDSMDLLYPPGAYIYVVCPIALGWTPRTGDRVVVERMRDGGHLVERTCKEVEVVRGGLCLWPRSRNPRWREAIELRDEDSDEVRVVGVVKGAFVPEGV